MLWAGGNTLAIIPRCPKNLLLGGGHCLDSAGRGGVSLWARRSILAKKLAGASFLGTWRYQKGSDTPSTILVDGHTIGALLPREERKRQHDAPFKCSRGSVATHTHNALALPLQCSRRHRHSDPVELLLALLHPFRLGRGWGQSFTVHGVTLAHCARIRRVGG